MNDQTKQPDELEEKIDEETNTADIQEQSDELASSETPLEASKESEEKTAASSDESLEEAGDTETTEDSTSTEDEGADEDNASDATPATPAEPESLNDVLADEKKHIAPDNAKWFIIHTYAGHENKVSRSLKQRVESMGFQERIFEILVPTRKTVRIVQGKKQEVEEKIFAGYVFVQMILDEETWLLVRTTQGVTAFIGPGSKPTPIPDKEVDAILKFMKTEQPMYKTGFIDGDVVKITDGPFADFEGTITNVDQERGKVKVTIMIFDRETPVELDFLQVQKL